MRLKAPNRPELNNLADPKGLAKRQRKKRNKQATNTNFNNSRPRQQLRQLPHAHDQGTQVTTKLTPTCGKSATEQARKEGTKKKTVGTNGIIEAWKHKMEGWWEIARVRLPAERDQDVLLHTLHETFADVLSALQLATSITDISEQPTSRDTSTNQLKPPSTKLWKTVTTTTWHSHRRTPPT